MRALRASRAGRRLIPALSALVLVLILGATPALADDGTTGAAVELTAAQQQKAHDELVPLIVKQVCDASVMGKVVSILPGGKSTCASGVSSMLPKSFESLQAFQNSIQSGAFCEAVSSATPAPGNLAVQGICSLAFNDAFSSGIKTAIDMWWSGFTKSIGAVVGFVDFIQNPSNGLEQIANSIKKDSVNALGTTLNGLSAATDFDAGDPAFRTVWASAAGIGLVVLAAMVLLTLRSSAAGKIDGAEATKSLVVWAPLAVLMMVFGPVIGHVVTGWLQPLNEGLINWGTAPMNTAINLMSSFASVPSSNVFGPFVGIFLWGLLLVGAWATFFLMIIWKASLLLMGIGIGVALGMLVNPLWRPKVMKLVGTFGGIMASKTILLFMLGAGFFLMNVGKQVLPGTSQDLTNIVNIFVSGLILVMVFLFPVVLLKYIPLTPEGSQSSHGAGSVAGAAVVAGTASAMSMHIANNRRDSINNQSRRGGSGSNTNSNTSWTPPQEPTKLTPGGGGGGGYGAQAHRGSQGATGGAGTTLGGARASAAGGAASRGAASTGAKTAGSVGAGASTAGVATAVQAGIAAGNAAAAKTREAVHAAAPDVPTS